MVVVVVENNGVGWGKEKLFPFSRVLSALFPKILTTREEKKYWYGKKVESLEERIHHLP